MHGGDPLGLWFGSFSEKLGEKNRLENRGKKETIWGRLGEVGACPHLTGLVLELEPVLGETGELSGL